jgi:transposase
VPKPFPTEFRRDVIAVARQGGQSTAQVARSFGISESCLNRWLKIADREDGLAGPESSTPAAGGAGRGGAGDLEAENRELRRRTKQLEQENEILRRATAYFARDVLPK